ncbi:hypothetical protein NKI94_07055 [Mesorhizobium australicum]|uniref:hypothetical protein n=1 Tax=Mesorhizobium australicum TaxID=536018 RepID=UPI00333D7C16
MTTIAPQPFDQIDICLCENLRTVLAYGYAGDQLWLQRLFEAEIDLDADTVETVEADQWRRKAKDDGWRKM